MLNAATSDGEWQRGNKHKYFARKYQFRFGYDSQSVSVRRIFDLLLLVLRRYHTSESVNTFKINLIIFIVCGQKADGFLFHNCANSNFSRKILFTFSYFTHISFTVKRPQQHTFRRPKRKEKTLKIISEILRGASTRSTLELQCHTYRCLTMYRVLCRRFMANTIKSKARKQFQGVINHVSEFSQATYSAKGFACNPTSIPHSIRCYVCTSEAKPGAGSTDRLQSALAWIYNNVNDTNVVFWC